MSETEQRRWSRRMEKAGVWVVALLCLSLVNILAISFYATATVDDYIYGAPVHYALEAGGGLGSVLSAIGQTVAYTYEDWQGTFSSVVLFAIQPGVWGEKFYFLTVWVMVGAVIASVFLALGCVRDMDRWGKLCLAGVLSFFCVQYLPDPSQWFYWWNGAAHYLLFWTLSVLAVTCQIRLTRRQEKNWKFYIAAAGCCLLGFFVGGGNYCTALVFPLVSGALTFLAWWERKPKIMIGANALIVICTLGGLLVSMAAPGNAVRQGGRANIPPVRAILLSFWEAGRDLWAMLDWKLLGAVMVCVPLFLYATRKSGYRYRWPLLVLAGSFCALAALYTPYIFVYEKADLVARIADLTWLAGVFFLFGNAFYLAGWANRKWGECPGLWARLEAMLLAGTVLLAGVAAFGWQDTNAGKAGRDLNSSVLEQYRQERIQRRETAKRENVEDRYFQELTANPESMYISGVATWSPNVLVDGNPVELIIYRGRGGYTNYVELEAALAFFDAEGELEPGDFGTCFAVRGRHFVPIRSFCETMGMRIDYKVELDTMLITTGE